MANYLYSLSQFANTVFVVVDAEGTDKATTLQDGCHTNHSVSKGSLLYIYMLFDFSIFMALVT